MIIYLVGLLTVAFVPSLHLVLYSFLLLPLLIFPMSRRPVCYYLVGVLVASCYGAWQLHHRLPLSHDRQDLVLSGYIVSLPEKSSHRTRFIMQLTDVKSDQLEFKRLRRIRLNHYQFSSTEEKPVYQSGDYLTLRVRVRSPHFLQNPYAFDLERHFLSSGWDASGTIQEVYDHSPKKHRLNALRSELRLYLHSLFPAGVSYWLMPAIILGDRTAMDSDIWKVLQRTGTAHLMVVSGLHIAVMSGAGFLLGNLVLSFFYLLGFRATSLRSVPLLTAFVFATCYAFLAGFNLPVQRAWIMVSIFLLGELRLFRLTGWQRWRLALVLVMTYQPLAVIQPGAWMSFVAVACLLWMNDLFRGGEPSKIRTLLRAQWMIFIGLMPVMAWVFQQLGLLAPLINLIAIPVFSFFVMALPVLFLLLFMPLQWLPVLIDQAITIFWSTLVLLAGVPWSALSLTKPNLVLLWLTLPLWLLLMMPLPARFKVISLFCLLPIVFPRDDSLDAGEFRAIVFDVGQGLAVLVQTADSLLLYDTGPGFPMGGSAWGFAISPWFNAYNKAYLPHLVISHNDLDHAGGFPDLQQQLSVGQKDTGSLELMNQGFDSCHQQQVWQNDDVRFRYLTDEPSPFMSENERSCVLEVRSDTCSLLLPGDVGHPTEYDLIRSGRLKKVSWLVAGHHGSSSSSSGVFIDRLNPDAVIYTAGFANRYGHPAKDVIQRFSDRNVQQYNTATDGAILLEAINGECRLTTQRKRKRRYWTNG